MAIIIEEEREKSFGIMTGAVWLVVFGLLAAAGYYIFFSNPGIIDTAIPQNFQPTQDISKITLNPDEILKNPVFQSLKPFYTTPENIPAGRMNPFAPF